MHCVDVKQLQNDINTEAELLMPHTDHQQNLINPFLSKGLILLEN